MAHILGDLVAGADSVLLVAPYIKANMLEWLLSKMNGKVPLVCITRWRPEDILGGASDLSCRPQITERGGDFLLHSNLHAKYYRGGSRILVGSANISWSALGEGHRANLEILCAPGDDFDSGAFEKRLLSESRTVSDPEYERWLFLEAMEVPAPSLRYSFEEVSPFAFWMPRTRDPRHLYWFYQGESRLVVDQDEATSAKLDLELLAVPRGLGIEEFNCWVGACILSAPFFEIVRRLRGLPHEERWRRIAEDWKVSLSVASWHQETAEAWFRSFLPEV